MAEGKDIKIKQKGIIITEPPTVDMNILEYLYVVPYEDAMKDDALMELICNNGFYKTAFAEAHQLDTITVTVNKKDYKIKNGAPSSFTVLDTFEGKASCIRVNVIVIDSSKPDNIPDEDKTDEMEMV